MWKWLKCLFKGSEGGASQVVPPCTSLPGEHPTSPEARRVKGQNLSIAGSQTPIQQDLSSHDQSSLQAAYSDNDASLSAAEGTIPAIKRYIYSDGKPVGIANTVTKYQESKIVEPHLTPFEARLEAKIAEEEVARAALQASTDDNQSTGVKQQLLFMEGQQPGLQQVQLTAAN